MNVNKGKLFIRIGLLLIVAALLLTVYNIYENKRAGRLSQEALDALNVRIADASLESLDTKTNNTKPLYERYPQMDMPHIDIDGVDYIGILKIDKLNLSLPIKGKFSYSGLRIAPCRYDGSVYTDNMIIAGHNFSRHFGNLKNLSIDDTASFTDADGNSFMYKVTEITQIKGTDIEGMKNGDWDLTLFTCTISGGSRVAVRFERI